MGNQLKSTVKDVKYYLENDIGGTHIRFEKTIGNGRFLKTLKCHDMYNQSLVLKIFFKGDEDTAAVTRYKEILEDLKSKLFDIDCPNFLPFVELNQTDKAGYIIRQYVYQNLRGRLSIRPFLVDIEKLWITYQLLYSITVLHQNNLKHGDLKPENVLLTSWNWLFISDFAPYKPTLIPEDNPSEYYYYFLPEKGCYIAPERFYTGTLKPTKLTNEMDLFSVGCIIAELWLEEELFSYPTLIKYIKGEYDPTNKLKKIENKDLRNFINDLISLNPEKRIVNEEQFNVLFPSYFSYFHSYIYSLMVLSPDEAIATIYGDIHEILQIIRNEKGDAMSNEDIDYNDMYFEETELYQTKKSEHGGANDERYDESSNDLFNEIPEPFYTLINHWSVDDVCVWLTSLNLGSYETHFRRVVVDGPKLLSISSIDDVIDLFGRDNVDPHTLFRAIRLLKHPPITTDVDDSVVGLTIILDFLSSLCRNVTYPHSIHLCLLCFQEIAPLLNDECRLQKIIPLLVSLLRYESSIVRAQTVKTLTKIISTVNSFPSSDANIFPEYILPSLKHLLRDGEDVMVLQAYAKCVPSLAKTARKFLESSQYFKDRQLNEESTDISTPGNFKHDTDSIRSEFRVIIQDMLSSNSPKEVKMALLNNISELCIFFGQEQTNDFVLPLITTVLNDRDVMCICFEKFKGIAAVAGPNSIKSILPFVLPEIYNPEEYVILRAVQSLNSLCNIHLLTKKQTLEIASEIAPLLIHPNSWIKYSTTSCISAIGQKLSIVDSHCLLIPLIRPFLERDITDVTIDSLLHSLITPIPRISYDRAIDIDYFSVSNKSTPLFSGKNSGGVIVINNENDIQISASTPLNIGKQRGDRKNIETKDILFMFKISSLNVSMDDESKIFLMKEYLKQCSSKYREFRKERAINADFLLEYKEEIMSKIVVCSISESMELNEETPGVQLLPASPPSFAPLVSVETDGSKAKDWEPQGNLISHLVEHQGAVNSIVVSSDNMFFASGSDDGIIRIWDTQRLDKHPIYCSKVSFDTSDQGPIVDMVLCENSHAVACASNNIVNLFNVECTIENDSKVGFSGRKISEVESIEGNILSLDHYDKKSQSLLIYATDRGFIHGVDLRSNKEAFRLKNNIKYGMLTSFLVDENREWLSCGTNRGFISCFDLRFFISFREWRVPNRSPINTMARFNRFDDTKKIIVATGPGELQIWDIELGSCRYISRSVKNDNEIENIDNYLIEAPPASTSLGIYDLHHAIENKSSVRCITYPNDSSGIMTGGNDKMLRFWNVNDPASSYVISGGPNHDENKMRYKRRQIEDLVICDETPSSDNVITNAVSPNRDPLLAPPSPHHVDTITSLNYIESPQPMLISGSRDGVIKVWK